MPVMKFVNPSLCCHVLNERTFGFCSRTLIEKPASSSIPLEKNERNDVPVETRIDDSQVYICADTTIVHGFELLIGRDQY